MRNVNIPSMKILQEKLRLDPEKTILVRQALEEWKEGGPHGPVLSMANRHLRGFGVKTLFIEPSDTDASSMEYKNQSLCYYIDRNNVEKPTLIFDSQLENFKVMKLSEFLNRQKIT